MSTADYQTAYENVIKEVWEPNIHEQVELCSDLYQNFKKTITETTPGGRFEISVHSGKNSSAGSGSETDDLPVADYQKFEKPHALVKRLRARGAFTDFLKKTTESKEAAMADVMTTEFEGIKTDMAKVINVMLFGNGTGVIAQADGEGAGADATVTVELPVCGTDPTQHFVEGMYLDFFTAAGVKDVDGARIVSIDEANDQFELDAATYTWDDEDLISQKYARSFDSVFTNEDMMGIKGAIDDGTEVATFQGLARSTNTWWNSQVLANSGTPRAVTEALISQMFVNVGKYKGKIDKIVTSPTVWSSTEALHNTYRRYAGDTDKHNMGASELTIKKVDISYDIDCAATDMYFLDTSTFKVKQLSDMSFLDDGNILSRISGKAAYEFALLYYAQLINTAPRKNGVLRDVQ